MFAEYQNICIFYANPSSLLEESVRGIETDSGVAVQLFAFPKLESNISSEMNEFEGNHFPEPYLPNKQ